MMKEEYIFVVLVVLPYYSKVTVNVAQSDNVPVFQVTLPLSPPVGGGVLNPGILAFIESACAFMLSYNPAKPDTSFHAAASVCSCLLYPHAIVSSVKAKTALFTSLVCVRFGTVLAYILISLSVNTHTSPYTHRARFGINQFNEEAKVCASVSYGFIALILQSIGQVFIFLICSVIQLIWSSA